MVCVLPDVTALLTPFPACGTAPGSSPGPELRGRSSHSLPQPAAASPHLRVLSWEPLQKGARPEAWTSVFIVRLELSKYKAGGILN